MLVCIIAGGISGHCPLYVQFTNFILQLISCVRVYKFQLREKWPVAEKLIKRAATGGFIDNQAYVFDHTEGSRFVVMLPEAEK